MLQVLLTFPGKMSLEEFSNHVGSLTALGCVVQFNGSTETLHSSGVKSKKTVEDIQTVTRKTRITKNEKRILDQGLEKIFKGGTSPLLDSMAAKGMGRLKPNMSQEIVSYYKKNPGQTTAMGASALAEKFAAHYDDVNDAFTRIRNLINVLAHAKGNQKALEKRNGRRGPGGSGQVYALEN